MLPTGKFASLRIWGALLDRCWRGSPAIVFRNRGGCAAYNAVTFTKCDHYGLLHELASLFWEVLKKMWLIPFSRNQWNTKVKHVFTEVVESLLCMVLQQGWMNECTATNCKVMRWTASGSSSKLAAHTSKRKHKQNEHTQTNVIVRHLKCTVWTERQAYVTNAQVYTGQARPAVTILNSSCVDSVLLL